MVAHYPSAEFERIMYDLRHGEALVIGDAARAGCGECDTPRA